MNGGMTSFWRLHEGRQSPHRLLPFSASGSLWTNSRVWLGVANPPTLCLPPASPLPPALPAPQEELGQRERRWVARQEGRKREAQLREAQAAAWQVAKLEEEQEVLAQLVS